MRPRLPRALEKRVRRHRRQRPPRCPSGWSTGPPDYIGIGAQRAGTSWWQKLITEHPQVYGSRVKELHFFDRHTAALDPGELGREYARHFPRPQGGIAGEWTPFYMFVESAARQIHQVAPEARLLVLLRDPVERYRSGSVRRPDRARHAVKRGFYARQLDRFLEVFPRERILVQQYERCLREPGGELVRTYTFLGVDASFVPRSYDIRGARSFGDATSLPTDLRQELVRRYEPDVRRLTELGFDLDLSLWPNFAHLAE